MFTPALTELTSRDIEEGVPASHSATSRSAIIINTSPQYNYDSLSLPDLPDLPLPSLLPDPHSATSRSAIIINTSPQYNYDSLSLPDLPDLPLPSLLPDLPDLPAYIPEHLPDLPLLRSLPSLSGSINNESPHHYTVTNSLPNLPPLPLQIEDSAGTRGQSI